MGRPLYSYPSPRNDEDRVVSVGSLEQRLIAVLWMERDGVYRTISMRRARDGEERKFRALTADQLSKLKSETDWAKADAMTGEEIERQAEADDGPPPEGWEDTVVLGVPGPKRGVYLRLDPDVLDWIKAHGRGYQTRINAVLRAFVRARKQAEHCERKSK